MTLNTLHAVGQSPQQRVISPQTSGVLRRRSHDADPPREVKNTASRMGYSLCAGTRMSKDTGARKPKQWVRRHPRWPRGHVGHAH